MLRVGRRWMLQSSVGMAAWVLVGGCGLTPAAPRSKAPRRIGFVGSTAAQIRVGPFEEGLRGRGYLSGENIKVDYRWADTNEGLRAVAEDLVQQGAEVLVGAGGPPTTVAWEVSKSVPIVGVNFPVPSPYAASLAQTGTNVTGVVANVAGLGSKRLELLTQAMPSAKHIFVLWSGAREPVGAPGAQSSMARERQEMENAAPVLGVALQDLVLPSFTGSIDERLAAMFQVAVRDGAQAVAFVSDGVFDPYRERIVQLAFDTRLPAMYGQRDYADLGGLLAYGTSFPALYGQAAGYVDRILNGASPADLPVEQPTTFDFVINVGTAAALGLTIPPSVLQQATELIQ